MISNKIKYARTEQWKYSSKMPEQFVKNCFAILEIMGKQKLVQFKTWLQSLRWLHV